MRAKTFVITNEMFSADCLIRLGGSRLDAVRLYAKRAHITFDEKEEAESDHKSGTTFTAEHGLHSALWLKTWDKSPRMYAVLAHEAIHVASHVLNRSGAMNEEALAYYTEWVVREVLKRAGK